MKLIHFKEINVYRYIVTAVDYTSKFVKAEALEEKTGSYWL